MAFAARGRWGFLRRSGVRRAVNLEGGIDAWARVVDADMAVY